MTQQYCNPIVYMWVSKHELPDPEPVLIKDNDYICQVVSKHLGVTIEDMKSRTRKREIFTARATAMTFMQGSLTLTAIGEYFGGDDHHTVINAINAVSNLRDTNKRFREKFRLISEVINL